MSSVYLMAAFSVFLVVYGIYRARAVWKRVGSGAVLTGPSLEDVQREQAIWNVFYGAFSAAIALMSWLADTKEPERLRWFLIGALSAFALRDLSAGITGLIVARRAKQRGVAAG
jgi:hypothetical protein